MLCSSEKEITALRMSPLTGRVRKCEASVQVGSATVLRFPNGKWWSNCRTPREFNGRTLLSMRCKTWSRDLLEGLAILGIVSREAVDRHNHRVRKRSAEELLKNDQAQLEFLSKELGYKLVKLEVPASRKKPRGRSTDD